MKRSLWAKRSGGGRSLFQLLRADNNGNIWDLPKWGALGQSGTLIRPPYPEEMIKLPPGSKLVYLPGRQPLGFLTEEAQAADGPQIPPQAGRKSRNNQEPLKAGAGKIWAVAAVLPSGYLRTMLPAYKTIGSVLELPNFSYAACALKDNEIWVAAKHTDKNSCWNQRFFNTPDLMDIVDKIIKRLPHNRILQQLKTCAIEYYCYTAQNTFFQRWEAAIPISPSCNAKCVGCLSKPHKSSRISPQTRIKFIPQLEEILEIAIPHLKEADSPIISFGQGCEGEPTLQDKLLYKSIKAIREKTDRGIININTNGSKPEILEKLFKTGLDSIRVSMNSAVPSWFNQYYNPTNYGLMEIKKSLSIAKKMQKFSSINLLIMPGVTDSIQEIDHLFNFLEETTPSMIQLRNLNLDPDTYFKDIIQQPTEGIGIVKFLKKLKRHFPFIKLGNFTPSSP